MFLTSTYGNEGTFMENFVAMAFSGAARKAKIFRSAGGKT
jgi:hypothetical protein